MPLEHHGGLNLHVQELGAGPPVVMLHGLFVGSMATWYFTAAPLLAATHRVVLYDLRGHGKSERSVKGYDVRSMAADLESIVARFKGEPLTLVGHSYGALVALHFALRNRHPLRRLVLVEAPVPPSRPGEVDDFVGRRPEEIAEALPFVLRETVGRGGRRAARFVDGLRFLAFESSLPDDLRHAEPVPDSALSGLACPVLCIYGTESSCLPAGKRLAGAIPGARLVTVRGGHFLPVEAPQILAQTIAEFCNG